MTTEETLRILILVAQLAFVGLLYLVLFAFGRSLLRDLRSAERTREAAREAERIARDVLAEHGVEADFALARWHPLAEEWEPADVPLPRTESERAAEHERLEQRETEESQATDVAQWEVRVELASHRDAVALAERLEADSYAVARRWRFLLVGANSEDEAKQLAQTIEAVVPPGARVEVNSPAAKG